MKKQILSILLIYGHLLAFSQIGDKNFVRYVNPLIGTKKMGHTFPGATVPFGMVQLSPETDTISYEKDGKYNGDVYAYCSGYQYDDKTIVGFSHTHFSGTGHSDLGDFLIMPTSGKLQMNPGISGDTRTGYRSSFSHINEKAEPGYYSVKLDDDNIIAELTSTTRVGFHQYTFQETDSAHIIFDLISGIYNYENKNVWTFVRVENDTLVTGFRQTNGWARTRIVFFAMSFSKPFYQYGQQKLDNNVYKGFWRKFDETKNFPEMAGEKIRAYFDFKMEKGEKLKIKFALSPVSSNGAINNMKAEIPGWDFDVVKKQSQDLWNKELGKIDVECLNEQDCETFYTALYHSFLSPITYCDADGNYRGLDMNIYHAQDFTNYTIFSLWDTFRALHPLFNIVQPSRNADMVKSMLEHYKQSAHQMLPIWSHYANENWCMIGYHSVSVIADAIAKGNIIRNIDEYTDACIKTSNTRYFDGIAYYLDNGFVPEDKNSSSVSKTLEYAYDDWCIAQIARKSGNEEMYNQYLKRSGNYKNVFDANIGFMRPKLLNGKWKEDFNTLSTHGQGFIEGNSWNYGLYVPQDINGMIKMMGGNKKFTAHLDSLFTMQIDDKHFAETEDITRDGIIGNYVHGNEPGHHIAYLYNWADQAWKTQERVRMICETMYSNTPDGLCGNDDAGQMSAWYIFSSLGFYPVCPGSDEYAIGSPGVKSARLNLENGKILTVKVLNQSKKNVYVRKVILNGSELKRKFLNHKEIMDGGSISFIMDNKPVK